MRVGQIHMIKNWGIDRIDSEEIRESLLFVSTEKDE